MREERLEGVLVVVADITHELQRQREEAEFAELMQALRCMLLDRSGFAAFLSEAALAVNLICKLDRATPLPVLKSSLHTLKGNAAQVGLTVIAGICHSLEDELVQADQLSPESVARLANRWQAVTADVERFTGPLDRDILEISNADYVALISTLSRGAHAQAMQQALSWRLEPAARPLRRLATQAQALAKRLGKGELEVQVEAPAVRLDMDQFGPFFSDLVHLVRNAVDHGIESAEERRASGKPAGGRLVFRIQPRDRSLQFELSDDGAGIDWESVRHKGDALGLPSETPDELLELICQEGLTTRSSVTETSGRGVGLSAVKQRIQALHGTLAVESARGAGTTWKIVLPWAPEQTLERLRQLWQPAPVALSNSGVRHSA
jgi:chemotaxis protein histidine kinase CheA